MDKSTKNKFKQIKILLEKQKEIERQIEELLSPEIKMDDHKKGSKLRINNIEEVMKVFTAKPDEALRVEDIQRLIKKMEGINLKLENIKSSVSYAEKKRGLLERVGRGLYKLKATRN